MNMVDLIRLYGNKFDARSVKADPIHSLDCVTSIWGLASIGPISKPAHILIEIKFSMSLGGLLVKLKMVT